jgi:hypothetical protein
LAASARDRHALVLEDRCGFAALPPIRSFNMLACSNPTEHDNRLRTGGMVMSLRRNVIAALLLLPALTATAPPGHIPIKRVQL